MAKYTVLRTEWKRTVIEAESEKEAWSIAKNGAALELEEAAETILEGDFISSKVTGCPTCKAPIPYRPREVKKNEA